MKKIMIFYGSYGGGHLSAARSIREYIENNNIGLHSLILNLNGE